MANDIALSLLIACRFEGMTLLENCVTVRKVVLENPLANTRLWLPIREQGSTTLHWNFSRLQGSFHEPSIRAAVTAGVATPLPMTSVGFLTIAFALGAAIGYEVEHSYRRHLLNHALMVELADRDGLTWLCWCNNVPVSHKPIT